jgi:SAM-dependent methyltransferase
MGISKYAASSLIAESKRIPFEGSILELGKQDIGFDIDALQKIAVRYNYELKKPKNISLNLKEAFSCRKCIDDKYFFSAIGFNNVSSLDFSNYESADVIFDLNTSETPDHLLNSFDVIFDGGTIEHTFHLPNVMKNIVNMLKIGGRIIHNSPSSNYVDHGFYMFSPTFFMDYYLANKFEINTINLFRHSRNSDNEPFEFYNYSPDAFSPYSYGGLDGAMYGVLCIATKTRESTNNVVPQQGSYQKIWEKHNHYQNLSVNNSLYDESQMNNGFRLIKDHTPQRIHPIMSSTYRISHEIISRIRRKYDYYVKDYCYGRKPNLKINDEIKV